MRGRETGNSTKISQQREQQILLIGWSSLQKDFGILREAIKLDSKMDALAGVGQVEEVLDLLKDGSMTATESHVQ